MTHPLGTKWLQETGQPGPPLEDISHNHMWFLTVERPNGDKVWQVFPLGYRTGNDPVNHPSHYTSHPSGVECITITEHMTFNLGNAVKYLWRAGDKGDMMQDLEKAAWYIAREIERVKAGAGKSVAPSASRYSE